MYNQNPLLDADLDVLKQEENEFLKTYGGKYEPGTFVKLSESDNVIYTNAGPMLISKNDYLDNEITNYQGFRPENGSYINGYVIKVGNGENSYYHSHSMIDFQNGHGLETYDYGKTPMHTPIYNIGRHVENIIDLTKQNNLDSDAEEGSCIENGRTFDEE